MIWRDKWSLQFFGLLSFIVVFYWRNLTKIRSTLKIWIPSTHMRNSTKACDGFCYLCFIFMTLRTVTYKRQELFTLPEHLGFGRVRLAHLFSFMCCFVFLCFVCLRPVSCVHNVVSVSGFTILDCPIGFL